MENAALCRVFSFKCYYFENNVWGTEDPDWEKRFFTNNFTNFPKNQIKIVKDILNPSNNNTPHQEKRQIKQIILFLNH